MEYLTKEAEKYKNILLEEVLAPREASISPTSFFNAVLDSLLYARALLIDLKTILDDIDNGSLTKTISLESYTHLNPAHEPHLDEMPQNIQKWVYIKDIFELFYIRYSEAESIYGHISKTLETILAYQDGAMCFDQASHSTLTSIFSFEKTLSVSMSPILLNHFSTKESLWDDFSKEHIKNAYFYEFIIKELSKYKISSECARVNSEAIAESPDLSDPEIRNCRPQPKPKLYISRNPKNNWWAMLNNNKILINDKRHWLLLKVLIDSQGALDDEQIQNAFKKHKCKMCMHTTILIKRLGKIKKSLANCIQMPNTGNKGYYIKERYLKHNK